MTDYEKIFAIEDIAKYGFEVSVDDDAAWVVEIENNHRKVIVMMDVENGDKVRALVDAVREAVAIKENA